MSSSPEVTDSHKKRKREVKSDDDDDKLEIDINLPEPPSKKAKRKEKKQAKSKSSKTESPADQSVEQEEDRAKQEGDETKKGPAQTTTTPAERSKYGIWVGNLAFNATRDTLRDFLLKEGGIDEGEITRVHLPTGERGRNKGFAYVDFKSPATLEVALTLSEKLSGGRRLLIKNATNFEGRPKETAASKAAEEKKEPSKRVFVGNLSFDVNKAELAEHFGQAGKVEDVFMATFEDSGKSKGFAWVTFADIEDAKKAVQGYIWKDPELDDEDLPDESDPANKKIKKHKPRKWFINRLHARELRCEFAEDAQTRYKKRFGKAPSQASDAPGTEPIQDVSDSVESLAQQAAHARTSAPKRKDSKMKHLDKDQRQEVRRKRHDARMIAPGKALANTQRATGAIVEGKGNKVTFD